MTTDEIEIIQFLKQNPETYFARKEIARKAKRRHEYEENPHWAGPALNSLVAQKHVTQNETGHYRLSETYSD